MLVCFLVEAHKSLLDHLITMHEQYVTGLLRRSQHAFDERHREFRKRARRGIHTVLSAMEILLERRTGDPLMALYHEIDESTTCSGKPDETRRGPSGRRDPKLVQMLLATIL